MLDRCNLLKRFDVKFLFVAEDDVAIGLACHQLLLEADDVAQLQGGQSLIDLAVDVIVDSQVLG